MNLERNRLAVWKESLGSKIICPDGAFDLSIPAFGAIIPSLNHTMRKPGIPPENNVSLS